MNGAQHAVSAGDYMMDMLFHGLQQIEDIEVIESDYLWHCYKCEKDKHPHENHKLWGKGFTSYFLCEPTKYTYDQIKGMLEEKKYDVIMLPLHHTFATNYSHIHQTVNFFRQFCNKIVVIDGHDFQGVHHEIASKTIYFKRELIPEHEDKAIPISFAFPEEKICKEDVNKTQDFSGLIPVNQNINPEYMKTYIYDTEEAYYNQYKASRFALTSKKGGWDTLRHYEILANKSVPVFVDIEKCPQKTLWNFPKDLCKRVLNLPGLQVNHSNWNDRKLENCNGVNIENPGSFSGSETEYEEIRDEMFDYFCNNLTTKHLAKYVLERI